MQVILEEYKMYEISMCLYHHKKVILKSLCFIISSCMGYWKPLYACKNICYLYWLPYVKVYWLHWSMMSWTCGIQRFLPYSYIWKYHNWSNYLVYPYVSATYIQVPYSFYCILSLFILWYYDNQGELRGTDYQWHDKYF